MRFRGASNFNGPLVVDVRRQEKQHTGRGHQMLPPPNSPEALNASDPYELETVYWTPSTSFDRAGSVDYNWSAIYTFSMSFEHAYSYHAALSGGAPWNSQMLSSTPIQHKSLSDLGGGDEALFFSLGERVAVQEQTKSSLFYPAEGIQGIPTIPSFPGVGNVEGNSTSFEKPPFPFLEEVSSIRQEGPEDIFDDQLDITVSTIFSTRKLEALDLNRQTGDPTVILDESFNDSGLDFPLEESPESWGPRKYDEIHKPGKLRLVRIEETGNDQAALQLIRNGPLFQKLTEPPPVSSEWSFEEQIVISLLQEGVIKESRENGERCATRRPRRMSMFASASEKITKVAKRFRAATFRR